jgi:hypothetical protein
MGWSFCYSHQKLRQCIEDRIKSWANDSVDLKRMKQFLLPGETIPADAKDEDYRSETVSLKHVWKGMPWSGTLWQIFQTAYYRKSDNQMIAVNKWIACDLVRYDNKDKCFGHKDMSESCGPYVFNVPGSWLDEVPVPTWDDGTPNEHAVKWREGVRLYNQKLNIGDKVKTSVGVCEVISMRPMACRTESGRVYKLSRRDIIGETETPESKQNPVF